MFPPKTRNSKLKVAQIPRIEGNIGTRNPLDGKAIVSNVHVP